MTNESCRLFVEVLEAAVADLEALSAAYPSPLCYKPLEDEGSIEGQSLQLSADAECRPVEH